MILDSNDEANRSERSVQENRDDLAAFLKLRHGERHVIVLQDYPDPDAISSAFAYQLISGQFGIRADILYSGKISHQQNIALVRLLGIPLVSFDVNTDLSIYQGAVYIDNQGTTSSDIVDALQAASVPPLVMIDHHEPQDRISPVFTDIRKTGATATIFSQYFEQGLLSLDPAKKEHVLVATALLHGIMTDTANFIRAGKEDFLASAFLSRFHDQQILAQVISQSRSRHVMEFIFKALSNRFVSESFSIAGIGYLRAEDRDVIPQAADFLLTEENVNTVIVYGIVTGWERGERLVGSMRTTRVTLDPDDFIKETLGKDARGHYFGGGKISAGGFEIPVGFLSGGEVDEYHDIKWQVFDNQIKQKFFARIGVQFNPDR
jgi:nanoRNase/pAp phosphatase (c-di-AMP/oligoRNAs hydrolase)